MQMMLSKCRYCGYDNCFGHTNDEKAAIDYSKTLENSVKRIADERDRLRAEITKLAQAHQSAISMASSEATLRESISKQLDNVELQRDQLRANLSKAVEGLKHINAIKNKYTGGDWDEIEEARSIARAALESIGEA